MDYSRKNQPGNRGGGRGEVGLKTNFLEHPVEVLLTRKKSAKLCYTSQTFYGLKPRTLDIPHYFFLVTHGNSTLLLISPRKVRKSTCYIFKNPIVIVINPIEILYPQLPFLFSFLVIMIEHIKMMQTPYLDIWSMLLSGQVFRRLIEAIKVTCFGISRRR